MSTPDDQDPKRGNTDDSGWGDAWTDDGWGETPAPAPAEDDVSMAQTQALNPVTGPMRPLHTLDAAPATPPPSAAHAAPPTAGPAAAAAPESHLPPRKQRETEAGPPGPPPHAAPAAPASHLPPRKQRETEAGPPGPPPGAAPAAPSHAAARGEALAAIGDDANITTVDIEEGKNLAALCHAANVFGIPLWIFPLFIQKENPYAVFHAKQAAAGTAVYWAGWVLVSIIGSLTCGVGLILGLALPVIGIWPAVWAYNGQTRRLPLVGNLAADLFKGIQAEKKG